MTSDQFCLKWNNYQASLTNAFKSLLENEDFVDVTLSAGGKTLRAHKVVLSACSSYFKQLLTGINSWQHPILFLRDVPFVDLYTILEFIYMGEVNVGQSDLTSFLKTAELLQIKGLAENANWSAQDSLGEVSETEDGGSDAGGLASVAASPIPAVASTPRSEYPVSSVNDLGGQTKPGAKRRRLSSETSTSKLLNDSGVSTNTRPSSVKSEEDMELKEEVNDDFEDDDDNNLYVDESADTDTEVTEAGLRRMSGGSIGDMGGPGLDSIMMGPNHKKCIECGIVMLKKNYARHQRDMHAKPKPRALCPLCQKSYKTSDWLKDHIRRGHGYTKELTDRLMSTLVKTPGKNKKAILRQSPAQGGKVPPLLSIDNVHKVKSLSKEATSNSSLALIDIQQQPMTVLKTLSVVKQESDIAT